jgi:ferredoxin
MPHIVTEPCIGCKNTVCVTVCPVDCFREDADALWIDPDECIDCGACVPECPVQAIFEVAQVPSKWKHFVGINAEKAKILPVINQRKEPLKP